jgi:thiol:disulfide interchange protein
MSEETTTSTPVESGDKSITMSEAASAFEGMLSTPEDSNEQPTEKEEDTQEAEVEETDVELEAEETEETEEVELAEEETEDESKIEDEEVVEEEQTFTIKAAGEEKEVTLDELKKSYQLGSDYTKKTQEVAEQRKVIEQEAKAIIEARKVRDDYAQKLQAVEQFLTGTNDSPEDLAAMKENDPIGYAVKVAEMTEKKEQLQQVQSERERPCGS